MEGVRIVALRLAHERELEVGDEGVVLVDEGDVHLDALPHARVGTAVDDAIAVTRIRQAFREGGQVVLGAGVLHVREELAALADQVQASAEQGARRSHRGRIDVGLRAYLAPWS